MIFPKKGKNEETTVYNKEKVKEDVEKMFGKHLLKKED